MAKFDPKTRRYKGDKGKFVSKENAYPEVVEATYGIEDITDDLGPSFEKETLEFAKIMGDAVEKKIEQIEKADKVIENVGQKVLDSMAKAGTKTARSRMLSQVMASQPGITAESGSQKEADEKKADIYKDIRHAAAPRLYNAVRILEDKKAAGGFGSGIAGVVGGMLQKYERYQLRKNGFEEIAGKVSNRIDQGVVAQPQAKTAPKSERARIIELLERIEKNTAGGGIFSRSRDDDGQPKKKQGLIGSVVNTIGSSFNRGAGAAVLGEMMGHKQSRDAMIAGSMAISVSKAIVNAFRKEKKDDEKSGDNFVEKDDSSDEDRIKNAYKGRPDTAAKDQKDKKDGSGILGMIAKGVMTLFPKIAAIFATLKTGLLSIVGMVLAKLGMGAAANAMSKIPGVGGGKPGSPPTVPSAPGSPTTAGKPPVTTTPGGPVSKAGGFMSRMGAIGSRALGFMGGTAAVGAAAYGGYQLGSFINDKFLTNEDGSGKIGSWLYDKIHGDEQKELNKPIVLPTKKTTGSSVQKAAETTAVAEKKQESSKHNQVINANKNITVNQSGGESKTQLVSSVRHNESSLRKYLDTRMVMA
jgi:hypothetical protein